MPAPQVVFQQYSNREDFITTVGLYDDDTGNTIDTSGVKLNNASGFTGTTWTVTDGAIVTSSSTSITIPPYPIGSQLSALSLTVGTSLAIVPGDAITIADPTGLNTLTGVVTSYTASTGALICQIGWTFEFEIRTPRPHYDSSGYIPWFDFGTPLETMPLITASLGNGLTMVSVGFLQILIRESIFRQLTAHTYMACLTGTNGTDTRQFFIGRLPILYGGVTQ